MEDHGPGGVASFVERMDEHFDNPNYRAHELISRRPSEYLRSGRIFFGCEGNEDHLAWVIDEIGADRLLYSSDYPHGDRTEGTVSILLNREDVSAKAKQKMLEENARQFYGQ